MLDTAVENRKTAALTKGASEAVLQVRAAVLDACRDAASKARGVFTLTVPTGGGKTLASVFFALKHIDAQNGQETYPHKKLRRVIVVIPYLNIIQQTVRELVEVFRHSDEDPIVLEHHSQAQDPPLDEMKVEHGKEADYSRKRTMRQLAAENWDAPIVVTTSVQFFDSLFSRRPADARKLHSIAQSVVIFDEVQTFPPRLMQPILDALGELTRPFSERPYGCSVVLCTATQPALLKSDDLACGFARVTEIVPKPQEMFTMLKRTTYPELEDNNPIPKFKWPGRQRNIEQRGHSGGG
jgi:CRISPR-associated endonuclease/helicase Cas3